MIRAAIIFTGLAATSAAFVPSDKLISVQSDRPETTIRMSDTTDRLQGIVRPGQLVDLPSLVPGIIAQIHVQEGQLVSKGTPLVTLDDRVPRARLAAATVQANLKGALKTAELELELAESRLMRVRSAVRKGAGAEFEIQEAQAARDQAEASVEQQRDILKAAEADRQLAEAQLSQYTISAPFDGIVTEIHHKSGAVDPSQSVITVANLDTLEVELHLPAAMYGSVRQNDVLLLNAGVPVSKSVSGTVLSVSPIINSASRTFRCLLKINNSRQQMPAGFSVAIGNRTKSTAQRSTVTGY